ncbi:hypothetical protein GLOIN_2v1875530 [Rhizophagus irregularis DAOM 181602=DAOM 197198]|uniref:Uncharacterized protein n=3 Tax=Rhizophagus irregularis TaxID=588596 RepID=A0A2P4Q2R3_RHIID|nr:hypothetical protein GLOIN_2v1875530 [Rhizophagus irregularis DAOM 181602=DAOM 197198]POG71951.1 hypothetical protein GLOIN_2v1875530 [Rhizophagus irregularis DAOM 181602=DAOM 197198]GBC11400.2 hypothetical protein GLOIN_2v1875530 [Rhizophagus irregularis DAOM 181602=DAOM 197198]|eukprot:XP_025178817.1 hypothetical protein GLOIN_2v1875530 [Rhizophagus irregularis DAOM 181602=DAOM 197198]
MEVDEEEARAEMKTILKTFPIELELIYDEKFSSESNDEILRQIIPRLIEAMKPRYTPRYRQKKALRVKGAKLLFDKNDEKLENYDRKELLNVLSDNRYHSPEYSESDEEQPDGKRHINVYNPSWRSEEIYNIVSRHPRGAPNWTYMEQNTLADTNFFEPETLIQTMDNLIMAEDVEVSAEMDEIEVIEDSEPTGMEESEPTEESEPMGVNESEPIGVEESPETEDETDKWYKFVL